MFTCASDVVLSEAVNSIACSDKKGKNWTRALFATKKLHEAYLANVPGEGYFVIFKGGVTLVHNMGWTNESPTMNRSPKNKERE